jgi:hypothetical protein
MRHYARTKMRDDIPAAALRLATVLPVRTNLQKEPDARKLGRAYVAGSGVFHTGKRVKIGAHVYDTIRDARTALRCSSQSIYRLIREGSAEYV